MALGFNCSFNFSSSRSQLCNQRRLSRGRTRARLRCTGEPHYILVHIRAWPQRSRLRVFLTQPPLPCFSSGILRRAAQAPSEPAAFRPACQLRPVHGPPFIHEPPHWQPRTMADFQPARRSDSVNRASTQNADKISLRSILLRSGSLRSRLTARRRRLCQSAIRGRIGRSH